MIEFETTDANCDQYGDLVDGQSDIVGEILNLDEFEETFPDHEVFMEVTNNHCYRPGCVECYTEVNGRLFFLDDISNGEAIELKISKEELIKQYQEVLG